MLPVIHNHIQETFNTTGLGPYTLLGAQPQMSRLQDRYALNASIPLKIQGNPLSADSCANEWQSCIGHLSGLTTLVIDSVEQSSNGDAAVSFSAGTKYVSVMPQAAKMNILAARFEQAFTAQTSVTVTHNLGAYPLVQVVDNSGDLIDVPINHGSVNAFTMTSSIALTGKIIYIG